MEIEFLTQTNKYGGKTFFVIPENVIEDIRNINDIASKFSVMNRTNIIELSIAKISTIISNKLTDKYVIDEKFKTEKSIYLYGFQTKEKYRHKGYGRRLLRHVLKQYSDCVIYLHVSSTDRDISNEQLIEFYEQEGFKKLYKDEEFQIMYIEL